LTVAIRAPGQRLLRPKFSTFPECAAGATMPVFHGFDLILAGAGAGGVGPRFGLRRRCSSVWPRAVVLAQRSASLQTRLRVSAMLEPCRYSAVESLPSGRRIEIRALKPADRADLLAAVDRASAQSLYRRFFSPKRGFTEGEIAYFLDVDFVEHVALVATLEEEGRAAIAGGGRYVVVGPKKAELAFAVVDQYQGQGIGAALMRHLAGIARAAGLAELSAEVLADNVPMLKVFQKSGLPMRTVREAGVVNVALLLTEGDQVAQHD